MDLNAPTIGTRTSQSRWSIFGVMVCFAVATVLMAFSLSHAGAATNRLPLTSLQTGVAK
jgi:uncharacterized membrane protein YccC